MELDKHKLFDFTTMRALIKEQIIFPHHFCLFYILLLFFKLYESCVYFIWVSYSRRKFLEITVTLLKILEHILSFQITT
jgi:hypothetical protein